MGVTPSSDIPRDELAHPAGDALKGVVGGCRFAPWQLGEFLVEALREVRDDVPVSVASLRASSGRQSKD